ncbi:MAG: hypothetical protein Q9220_000931 [cf. Caloplaca sp. 1 TL-2023]
MPPRDILGGGNASWKDNQAQSQAPAPRNPAATTAEGYQTEVEDASGYWAQPSAANRSDQALALSVARRSQTRSNVNNAQPSQQQYQQLLRSPSPVLGHALPETSDVAEGAIVPTSPWLDFLQSIPPRTNLTPTISGPSPSHDGHATSAGGDSSEVFSAPGPVSRLKSSIQGSRGRRATAGLITNPPRKEVPNMAAHAPIEGSSQGIRSAKTRQSQPMPRKVRTRSGLSQREDEAQSELNVPNQDASQASGSHSANSRASNDFSKLDRLDQFLKEPGIVRYGPSSSNESDGRILPDEKGFSIQIGSEVFKLSGASIMSDGYFISPADGRHFVKLYADAQFYRRWFPLLLCRPVLKEHLVPRLQSQLFESEIFMEVGDRHFRIPRDIFSAPGDTPNYFTLGFTVFFSSSGDVFPGLNPRGLLRPPAIHPPRIPNRSPESFAELLHILRGYPLKIRNNDHRNQLLRDARYYNLRGLEQKIIPHTISYNSKYASSEITVKLQDIKPSQISLVNTSTSSQSLNISTGSLHVHYARPFIPEPSHLLILELSDLNEPLLLDHNDMRIELLGSKRTRMTAFLQTIANKLNLPTTIPLGLMMTEGGASNKEKGPASTGLSEERVKAEIGADTHVVIDGRRWRWRDKGSNDVGDTDASDASESSVLGDADEGEFGGEDWPPSTNVAGNVSKRSRPSPSPSMLEAHVRKRRRKGSKNDPIPSIWTINKSQWRLKVRPKLNSDDGRGSNLEVIMVALKMEAFSGERAKNKGRLFLSS